MAQWEDTNKQNKNWRELYKPYITSAGVHVLPLHYRYIPERDPDRDGKEWYQNCMNNTLDKKKWERENEIFFSAAEGGLVYPEWNIRIHHLIEPITLTKKALYYCAVDPGVNVTAALWMMITQDGTQYLIDEYYEGDSVPNSEGAKAAAIHAQNIINKTQIICDSVNGTNENGYPNINGQTWIQTTLIDPSSFRREHSNLDLGSIAQRYIDAGIINLQEASRDVAGGIERVKEYELLREDRKHPNNIPGDKFPMKYSFPHLKFYVKEKKYYRYKQDSEIIYKKKDHLMDCERYLCVQARYLPVHKIKPKLTPIGKELLKEKGKLC